LAEVEDVGTGGVIAFVLPRGEGSCQGTFLYGPARASGTWSAACTNNLAASGTFASLGANKGFQGTGVDSRGRSVKFAISPPLLPAAPPKDPGIGT